MPKHRTLNLRRLISALSWDLFQEYFAQLRVDHRPSAWAYLNPDAMFDFLESPQNAQARSVILEDFRRINDICAARMDLVVRAYPTYHIPFNDHEPDLGLAMRLFLYHREAFNYAWSRYLFHSTASKVTLLRLGVPPLEIASDCLEKFGQELREWFRQLGKGLRDRAIILVLTLTGRRRAEVLNLKAGNLSREGDTAYYCYRGKGGKTGKRELPQPAFLAIQTALTAFGKETPLATMKPDESLWPSSSDSGRGITSGTFYGNLKRYFKAAGLRPAGVHILRHSAAKLRREAVESVEQVSQFLDHSSLAVTSVYLRQLEGERDTAWRQVADAIGV